MKTALTNFKLNVLNYKYAITGIVTSRQDVSPNGLKEIIIESVELDSVMCINHDEEIYELNQIGVINFSQDIVNNPMKYPNIIFYLQEQFKDPYDLRYESEQIEKENRIEFLED
jgi:hypothetical protein